MVVYASDCVAAIRQDVSSIPSIWKILLNFKPWYWDDDRTLLTIAAAPHKNLQVAGILICRNRMHKFSAEGESTSGVPRAAYGLRNRREN